MAADRGSGRAAVTALAYDRLSGMTEDGSLHTEGRKLDFGYPAAAHRRRHPVGRGITDTRQRVWPSALPPHTAKSALCCTMRRAATILRHSGRTSSNLNYCCLLLPTHKQGATHRGFQGFFKSCPRASNTGPLFEGQLRIIHCCHTPLTYLKPNL